MEPAGKSVPLTTEGIDRLVADLSAALENVERSQGGMVKLRKAELELNQQFEVVRDTLQLAVGCSDRSLILTLFGDCKRIAEVQCYTENAAFSANMGGPELKDACLKACESVESVLNDLGKAKELKAAKAAAWRRNIRTRQERLDTQIEEANAVLVDLGHPEIVPMRGPPLHRVPTPVSPPAPKPEIPEEPAAPAPADAPAEAPVTTGKRIVRLIRSGELRTLALKIFVEFDVRKVGYLEWNTRAIANFIKAVFQQLDLPQPTEHQRYSMYTRFDADGSWSLDGEECASLIEMLCCELFGVEAQGHREQIANSIHGGQVAGLAGKAFGKHAEKLASQPEPQLSWNSGAVRSFIQEVFGELGLPKPSEEQMFAMCKRFDIDRSMTLDEAEARQLVETLCRSMYHVEAADAATSCSKGHVMTLRAVPTGEERTCSICQVTWPAAYAMWRCDLCNYDMCVACSKNKRKDIPAASDRN